MKEITIFNNDEFGQIRTTNDDTGEPLFCLSDVCKVLELRAPQVKRRLDDAVVSKHIVKDVRGRRNALNFVSENGLYDAILYSRKLEARAFRVWITSEVLPCIRRHGIYAGSDTIERIMNDPDYGISLLSALKSERQARLEADAQRLLMAGEMNVMKPMAEYCRQILLSASTVTVTQIAQDYGYSAKGFNELLRDIGVQFRQNEQWILYSKYKLQGYVQSNTAVYMRYNGSTGARMYTRWTQRGRLFLYDKLKNAGILPLIEQDNEA